MHLRDTLRFLAAHERFFDCTLALLRERRMTEMRLRRPLTERLALRETDFLGFETDRRIPTRKRRAASAETDFFLGETFFFETDFLATDFLGTDFLATDFLTERRRAEHDLLIERRREHDLFTERRREHVRRLGVHERRTERTREAFRDLRAQEGFFEARREQRERRRERQGEAQGDLGTLRR